jgi:hypothetical protein
VCKIFTGNSDYGQKIYGRNKFWILHFFTNITAIFFAGILSKLRSKIRQKKHLFHRVYSGRNEKITAKNIPTVMKKIQESTPGDIGGLMNICMGLEVQLLKVVLNSGPYATYTYIHRREGPEFTKLFFVQFQASSKGPIL